MAAVEKADAIDAACAELLELVKEETNVLTLREIRQLHSTVREAEGYLQSVRKLLRPPGVL